MKIKNDSAVIKKLFLKKKVCLLFLCMKATTKLTSYYTSFCYDNSLTLLRVVFTKLNNKRKRREVSKFCHSCITHTYHKSHICFNHKQKLKTKQIREIVHVASLLYNLHFYENRFLKSQQHTMRLCIISKYQPKNMLQGIVSNKQKEEKKKLCISHEAGSDDC